MQRKNNRPEEFTPIDECVSTTGKYSCAFGQHFRPTLCYDVLAHNNYTNEVIRRHYDDRKEEAQRFWEEFKQLMTAPRSEPESEEKDELYLFGPGESGRRIN
jgi:hypothetical protein